MDITQDNRETLQVLRSVINQLQAFNDDDQCKKCMRQIGRQKVVLFVSGKRGRKMIPSINSLPTFVASYVFCQDLEGNEEWYSKYSEVSIC